ncbi:hypothetical protein ACFRKE_36565 [Kitasatospora indigofera]|uniref:barstar family protein n=1 Tax=Kitasatospora indigofera TaxID=67307 RepID=UPI0036C48B06
MPTVHEDENQCGPGRPTPVRYTLTGMEHGRALGSCAEVEGLFGEPPRGTYELFGWTAPAAVSGWVGSRVWLVPEAPEEPDPWLLEDVEALRRSPGSDALVLTGLDDYEGPPEGYRGAVRLHDGHRWLGSCREFARVLPSERAGRPLVLRGLAPGEQLRAALAQGTRRALDLEQADLEIRDDRGEPLTQHPLPARISAWYPSSHGAGLIDLELDDGSFAPLPSHTRPVLERWFAGPPEAPGSWAALDTRLRGAWLRLVQDRGCRRPHRPWPAGHAYRLDGRHITDEPGLYLALGEAVNGPGGYFGGCLAAVDDCLGGRFGRTAPATLLWRDAATAREHLSRRLAWNGRPHDLFAAVLGVLAEGGMDVTLA